MCPNKLKYISIYRRVQIDYFIMHSMNVHVDYFIKHLHCVFVLNIAFSSRDIKSIFHMRLLFFVSAIRPNANEM